VAVTTDDSPTTAEFVPIPVTCTRFPLKCSADCEFDAIDKRVVSFGAEVIV
jgi:hypothetical protein